MAKKKNKKSINKQIPTKDYKILWARAAGRCSFPKCSSVLTLDKIDGTSATLGAICHVIAKSKVGPRGNTSLTLVQRNSYPNLILLCSHHHDIIDEDSKRYPIEILHEFKAKHEQWVTEKLSRGISNNLKPEDMVFYQWIDTLSTGLNLDNWDIFINQVVNERVHTKYSEVRDYLNRKLIGTIWSSRQLVLKNAITGVVSAFDAFITHFETHSELSGDFLVTDKSWRRFYNTQFDHYQKEENKWAIKAYFLLCDYVVDLNKFSDLVREKINPLFFREYGQFVMIDYFGRFSGGKGLLLLPTKKYVRENLELIEKGEFKYPE